MTFPFLETLPPSPFRPARSASLPATGPPSGPRGATSIGGELARGRAVMRVSSAPTTPFEAFVKCGERRLEGAVFRAAACTHGSDERNEAGVALAKSVVLEA